MLFEEAHMIDVMIIHDKQTRETTLGEISGE